MRLKKIGRNKRALSEIVSYALLILIAFIIGTGVFVWMKSLIDEPREKCPEEGVSLVIRDAACDSDNNEVLLTISNQGRFNISGFIVKGSDNPNVMPAVSLTPDDYKLTDTGDVNVLISELSPGEEGSYKFKYDMLTALSKISVMATRVQFDGKSDKTVTCTNSLVGQDVSCT